MNKTNNPDKDLKALDIEFLESVTDCNMEFEKDLLATFIESCKSNINKMAESIENKDDTTWRMASHSFKGASSSIGAFDLSSTLEIAQSHKEGSYKEKSKLLKEIEEKFQLVVKLLNERIYG